MGVKPGMQSFVNFHELLYDHFVLQKVPRHRQAQYLIMKLLRSQPTKMQTVGVASISWLQPGKRRSGKTAQGDSWGHFSGKKAVSPSTGFDSARLC